MGRLKEEMLNDYLYCKENGLPVWRPPVSAARAVALRNNARHNPEVWEENMPDLMGEALAQAERDFLATVDLTAWEQLELDLWEGQHGVNEQTYWDVAGRGSCE
jgi:hypothetical protein